MAGTKLGPGDSMIKDIHVRRHVRRKSGAGTGGKVMRRQRSPQQESHDEDDTEQGDAESDDEEDVRTKRSQQGLEKRKSHGCGAARGHNKKPAQDDFDASQQAEQDVQHDDSSSDHEAALHFDDEDEASDDARGAVPLIHSRNSRKRKTQSKASRAQSHGASRGRGTANQGHVGQRSKGTGRHMSKGKEKMCTSEDEPPAQQDDGVMQGRHVSTSRRTSRRKRSKQKEKMCTSEDEISAEENICTSDDDMFVSQYGQVPTKDRINSDDDDFQESGQRKTTGVRQGTGNGRRHGAVSNSNGQEQAGRYIAAAHKHEHKHQNYRVPCEMGDVAVDNTMQSWQERSLIAVRQELQERAHVVVKYSDVSGLGLYNNGIDWIPSGQVLAVLSHGAVLPCHTERCVQIPGGFQQWTPVYEGMPCWCAGGAANECSPEHPISAVIKPRRCRDSRSGRHCITVLISCAAIPPGAEIFTYYGNDEWAHRGEQ